MTPAHTPVWTSPVPPGSSNRSARLWRSLRPCPWTAHEGPSGPAGKSRFALDTCATLIHNKADLARKRARACGRRPAGACARYIKTPAVLYASLFLLSLAGIITKTRREWHISCSTDVHNVIYPQGDGSCPACTLLHPQRSFKRTQICSMNRTLSVRSTLCRAGRNETVRRRPAPRVGRGLGDLGFRRHAATGLGGAGSRIGRVLRSRGCGTGTA